MERKKVRNMHMNIVNIDYNLFYIIDIYNKWA